MANVVFALTSARSGTFNLRELFRLNADSCHAVHEPLWQRGNPTMFGPPIHWATSGEIAKVRERYARKAMFIQTLPEQWYVETSHAFLKSAYLVAHEFFPDLKLLHVIRDPIRVAKSQVGREGLVLRWHMPFWYYRADDGSSYRRWSLTGREPLFLSVGTEPLTAFQWFLLEWIEVENRAMRYLRDRDKADSCVTVNSPADLNAPEKFRAILDRFGIAPQTRPLQTAARQNRNPGTPTRIGADDYAAAQHVLTRLPKEYLSIFTEAPYQHRSEVQRLLELAKF